MTDCRIKLPRGDDRTVEFTITNKTTGAAINLTSGSALFTVRETVTGSVTFQKTSGEITEILITDATAGVLEVYIVPADTTGLDAGNYHYDLQITLANNKIYTPVRGILELGQDITYT